MKKLLSLLALAVCAHGQWADPPASGYSALNTFLASLAASHPVSALPSTCKGGKEVVTLTTDTPPSLNYCDTDNHWTKLGTVTSVAGRTGAVTLTKPDVGLANVDNTADANKPVSTAQATAIAAAQAAAQAASLPLHGTADTAVSLLSPSGTPAEIIGAEQASPGSVTYSAGSTYGLGAFVTYSGAVYQSLQASNTGNTPSSSPTWWKAISDPLMYFDSTSHIPIYLTPLGAYLGGMVAGIVNPSDSNCVQYINRAGVQVRGACSGGGSGTVTNVTIAGTAGQITATGTCSGATTINCTLSLPNVLALPGTVNKLTLTQPATGATLTLGDGKTLTVNNTVTLTATDGSTVAFGAGGTVVYTTDSRLSDARTPGAFPACVGTPGNTTGVYKSVCNVPGVGTLYACVNASGCTVAADWTLAGGASTINTITASAYEVARSAPYMMVVHDTIPYTALTAASTIQNLNGPTLPAKFKIVGVTVTHTTPLAGASGITTWTMSIGPSGGETLVFPAMSMASADTAGTYLDYGQFYSSSASSVPLIYQLVVSNGTPGNWGASGSTRLTSGQIDVAIVGVVMP